MKILACLMLSFCSIFAFSPMLLKNYKGDENLSGYLMSEKLDGVRGLWDGKNLKSRNNLAFNPPKSFTKCFPDFSLDGEIYSPNLSFEKIVSITNSSEDRGWDELNYYIFDLPFKKGNLKQRLDILRSYLDKNPCKNLKIIEQFEAKSHENVKTFYEKIIKNGGEGAVIRDANAPYKAGRSDKILKLKAFKDDECKIISYNPGKGKYLGMLGSFTCENLKDKKRFKIGSGLSEEMRKNPPKIGQIISYKYQNLSQKGLPRFPVFLRVREDLSR